METNLENASKDVLKTAISFTEKEIATIKSAIKNHESIIIYQNSAKFQLEEKLKYAEKELKAFKEEYKKK